MPQQAIVLSSVFEQELLILLYQFHYLKIQQIVKLLQKETVINYVRSKMRKLINMGFVETQFLPRTTQAGRTPMIYSLSAKGTRFLAEEKNLQPQTANGVKKHGFLTHTLQVNDTIIAAILLTKQEPRLTLFDWHHERVLKQHPILVGKNQQKKYVVPDGFLHFILSPPFGKYHEPLGIVFEIDRNTEDRYMIQEKISNYVAFAYGPYQQAFHLESLTIAFVVTEGGQKRLQQLLTWTEHALKNNQQDGELFLFAARDPGNIDPVALFCSKIWQQPCNNQLLALIE